MNASAVDSPSASPTAKSFVPNRRYVYIAAIFAGIGSLLFGYDTRVIPGALIFIKKTFGRSVFRQELAVSSVLVGAAVLAITEGSRSGSWSCGRGKLACRLNGLSHISVAVEAAWTEFYLLALWLACDWFLALLLLACAGDQRPLTRGDRSRLAQNSWCTLAQFEHCGTCKPNLSLHNLPIMPDRLIRTPGRESQ